MKFAIITHVAHTTAQNTYCAYAPYVYEMNIWAKQVTELIVVAPLTTAPKTAIESDYKHPKIIFFKIDAFDVLSFKAIVRSLIKIPKISYQIFKAMQKADHIHLRCPGNIGLLGCLIQMAFPFKPKTAKYAGNWDPKSKQPYSYKLQKRILSNPFLTRNMKVLVYGQWEGSTSNVKPFFTASYAETEKKPIIKRESTKRIDFLFVGTLVPGKNPLYAIQLIEQLIHKGYNLRLRLYGEGSERNFIEKYCTEKLLQKNVFFEGNHTKSTLIKAYQESHFVVLPSQSEGWPKALTEGMFWGCVAIATKVSCVPFMLDYGRRGILLDSSLEKDVLQIETVIKNQNLFDQKQLKALEWSRNYTLDVFEAEIKKLLLG